LKLGPESLADGARPLIHLFARIRRRAGGLLFLDCRALFFFLRILHWNEGQQQRRFAV
jgi:hypothetical protein